MQSAYSPLTIGPSFQSLLQSGLAEMQKHKTELFLETAEGVTTPLSLVRIEEEFNSSPSLYQGKEFVKPARKSLIDPLTR